MSGRESSRNQWWAFWADVTAVVAQRNGLGWGETGGSFTSLRENPDKRNNLSRESRNSRGGLLAGGGVGGGVRTLRWGMAGRE